MYLKATKWREELGDSPPPVVADLVEELNRQRIDRELRLSLRTAIRDAKAEFSFLRVKGLRSLLKFLKSIADSDLAIRLFYDTQTVSDLQVVSVLFQNSLSETKEEVKLSLDQIFNAEPIQLTSAATSSEVSLALRVLEGCCLLHKNSTILANQYKAVKVLLNILSTRCAPEQGACLDALLALMLQSPVNQMDFEAFHGIEAVAELMKGKQITETIRMKCAEFLLLLIEHVEGSDKPPFPSIHEDIRKVLGNKCASVLLEASQIESTLDPIERQTALQIHARRVIESLELF